MRKMLMFDSNFELARPSQVIFHILEQAAREDHLTVIDQAEKSVIAYHKDVEKDIDDYIKRLIAEVKNGK